MKTLKLSVVEKEKIPEKTSHEKKFLEFINTKRKPYEKILLKNNYERLKSILRGENPPPQEFEIQPTSICNANCSHCFARDYKRIEDKLNTRAAFDRIIEQALNFKKNNFKIEVIKLCGTTGDPFVNPLTLYAINQIHGERYIRVFTNAIKLAENKDNFDYLKTISKINNLNTSIDAGSTEVLHKIKPGSRNIKLEDILEANRKIRLLSKNGIQIEASFVITNKNYWEIAEFVKKVKEYDAANSVRIRIDLTDRIVSKLYGEEITRLIERAKSYEDKNFKVTPLHSEEEIKEKDCEYFSTKGSGLGCFTCRIWARADSTGGVGPCGHVDSADVPNYGNLLEKTFEEIWDSKEKEDYIRKLPMKGCHSCSPFSLATNKFLSCISSWPPEELDKFYNKYIKSK